jgi:hypothetical protein
VAIWGCDPSGSGTSARAGTFGAGSGTLTLRGRAGARAGFTVGGPPEVADAATGGAVTTASVFTLAISTAGACGAAWAGLGADSVVAGAASGSTRAAVGSWGAAGTGSLATGKEAAGEDSEVTTSGPIGGRGRRGATLAASSRASALAGSAIGCARWSGASGISVGCSEAIRDRVAMEANTATIADASSVTSSCDPCRSRSRTAPRIVSRRGSTSQEGRRLPGSSVSEAGNIIANQSAQQKYSAVGLLAPQKGQMVRTPESGAVPGTTVRGTRDSEPWSCPHRLRLCSARPIASRALETW